MEKLIITHMEIRKKQALVTALWRDGRLWNLELAPAGESRLLGSIHMGKVQKVLPDQKGAFVEIEGRLPCYFATDKITGPMFRRGTRQGKLSPGDELLVQVTREALKSKAPSVSSNLSFPGEYLVLTTENRMLGVSSRIPKPNRARLRQMLAEALGEERTYGVIVRTNAVQADREQLLSELSVLRARMDAVLKKGSYAPCYTRIMDGDLPETEAVKNCVWENLEKVITDDPGIYQRLLRFVEETYPGGQAKVELYEDPLLPLSKLFSLEAAIGEALDKRVWLKSGGFLVIEQTEACAVIDVNSGKYVAKRDTGEMAARINREAAREILRQIRLRNLSGIILVDFINMNQEEQEQLLALMRGLAKEDRITTRAVDVTELGIMELTRRKEKKTLAQQLEEL